MKKLFYILATTFMMTSCCSESTKVESATQSIKIENYCRVYKTKIENHTYIVLYGYERLAIEHDPECPYCKKHRFTEHKIETTDY